MNSEFRQNTEQHKHNQSKEVSMIVQEAMNPNQSHSFQSQANQLLNNSNFHSTLNMSLNRRKESIRGGSLSNHMDRSWLNRQDKDGILLYCSELNKQLEQKNQELMKAYKECSSYKALVEQKINECIRDGSNPLVSIVEQLQKERNDYRNELVEITSRENFLKDQQERLEEQISHQERILSEYESMLQQKDIELADLQAKVSLNEEKTSRFKLEVNNMQDIYDTKEKLQMQLENRIQTLEQDNNELLSNLENTKIDYQSYIDQLETEKNHILQEQNNWSNLNDIIASTFDIVSNFIMGFSKVTKIHHLSSIALPSFMKLMADFDFELQAQQSDAIHFMHDWIIALFEQVETNMILKMEENAETREEKIEDLQKDLVESVNIGKILKDKEVKLLEEVHQLRLSSEENRNAIHQNMVHEKGVLQQQQQQNKSYKAITEELIMTQKEVDLMKEEIHATKHLKYVREQQDLLLQDQLIQIQEELVRFKNQKEVYQNVIFKYK